jgi:hypothetical protein
MPTPQPDPAIRYLVAGDPGLRGWRGRVRQSGADILLWADLHHDRQMMQEKEHDFLKSHYQKDSTPRTQASQPPTHQYSPIRLPKAAEISISAGQVCTQLHGLSPAVRDRPAREIGACTRTGRTCPGVLTVPRREAYGRSGRGTSAGIYG